jgi:hypothetical protein
MNFTRHLVAILSVILACVAVASCVLLAPTANAQVLTVVPPPELTFNIPFNPKQADKQHYDNDKAFGAFAWKAFIALNWPADCSNGSPKTEKKIGQDPDAPRVWEFYNYPEDVFKPKGAKPNPQPVVPPECSSSSQPVIRKLELTEFASNPSLQPDVIRSDESLSPLLEGNDALVDREGNYILNESRMNPVEVKQILDKNWYSATNLQGFNNENNLFMLMCSKKDDNGIYPTSPPKKVPCSANEAEGTIELKAAWKVFPDPVSDERKSKYYTTKRTFKVTTDSGGKTVTVPLGLVGFHILHKTSNQGWVWSTFEHKDNAPDNENLPASGHYNLYDSDCNENPENCRTNTPHATKPYLWGDQFPYAVTKTESREIKQQIPSQITRLIPIKEFAKMLNSEWQKALRKVSENSVWQNYQLIGVQWLEPPTSPYNKATGVFPRSLANVTLEPYVQTDTKMGTGRSCIACHSDRARLPGTVVHADFSFFMGKAEFP